MTPSKPEAKRTKSFLSSEKQRKFESVCVIFLAIVIICITVSVIILRHRNESDTVKCGPEYPLFSVNINDAVKQEDGSYVSKDGLVFSKGEFYTHNGDIFGCPCFKKPCIRKCCGVEDEVYQPRSVNTTQEIAPKYTCVSADVKSIAKNLTVFSKSKSLDKQTYNVSLPIDKNHFYHFYGKPCESMYMKAPDVDGYAEENYLLEDGTIHIPAYSELLDHSMYCLEFVNGTVYTFECLPENSEMTQQEEVSYTRNVLVVGLLVSVTCLVLTLVVYTVLPQKSVHNRCMRCHAACLVVAFTILAYMQYPDSRPTDNPNMCLLLAFVMQYSLLGSFFWLSIMCYDIWYTFGWPMVRISKFFYYSLYAWGGPALIVAATTFVQFSSSIPRFLVKPEFGVDRCWFRTLDSRILYFYLPIGVLTVVNVFMFATTSLRLMKTNDQKKQLKSSESRVTNAPEKNRFSMYLKLFILMGASWLLEVVSVVVGGPSKYWIVPNLINALQGLFIFVIFVCQRKILINLNKKLCPGVNIIKDTSQSGRASYRTSNSRGSVSSEVSLNAVSMETR